MRLKDEFSAARLRWAPMTLYERFEHVSILILSGLIAVVIVALWGLGRSAVKSAPLGVIGLAALGLYPRGWNPVLLLFGGGGMALLARRVSGRWSGARNALWLAALAAPALVGQAGAPAPYSHGTLFLYFLKIGSVVFGSGYVLLAFLRADFVERLRWLTDQQLIDAVAVGQFTPGPVFSTATFIGYLTGGVGGALVATAGIFLPSFVFVAAAYPLLGWLRHSAWTGAFLDGVNVAALGLMAGVSWELGRAAIVDAFTTLLAAAALAALARFRINSAWLIVGGALAGIGHHLLTGRGWGS